MSAAAVAYTGAEAVRRRNHDLDAEILRLVDSLDPQRLTVPEDRPGGEAWSAAIVLGHLGEFPRFFAGELRRYLADPATPVGRTHEHPDRLAAVAAARDRSFDELRSAMVAAFVDLAAALSGLEDRHLAMTTNNRKYGAEPLAAFLDRYVIGHKEGHARQLAAMPAAIVVKEEQP